MNKNNFNILIKKLKKLENQSKYTECLDLIKQYEKENFVYQNELPKIENLKKQFTQMDELKRNKEIKEQYQKMSNIELLANIFKNNLFNWYPFSIYINRIKTKEAIKNELFFKELVVEKIPNDDMCKILNCLFENGIFDKNIVYLKVYNLWKKEYQTINFNEFYSLNKKSTKIENIVKLINEKLFKTPSAINIAINNFIYKHTLNLWCINECENIEQIANEIIEETEKMLGLTDA